MSLAFRFLFGASITGGWIMAGVFLTFAAGCVLLLMKEVKSAMEVAGLFDGLLAKIRARRKPPMPGLRRARPADIPEVALPFVCPVAVGGDNLSTLVAVPTGLPELQDLPSREPAIALVRNDAHASPEPIPANDRLLSNDRLPDSSARSAFTASENFDPDRLASILASFDDEEAAPPARRTLEKAVPLAIAPSAAVILSTVPPESDASLSAPEPVTFPEESAPEPVITESPVEIAGEPVAPASAVPAEAQLLPQRPPAPARPVHPLEIFRPDETRMVLGLKPIADREFSCANRRRHPGGNGSAFAFSTLSVAGELKSSTSRKRRRTTPVPKNPRDTLLSAGSLSA